MKKKLLRWCLAALIFSLLLLGCRQEADWTNDQTQVERAEAFFRNTDHNAMARLKNFSPTLVSTTIAKLKRINDKTGFVSRLSDKKGLPAWNYMIRAKNKTTNKGEESPSVIIVPLKIEEGFLSSVLYIEHPETENPEIHTVTNGQLRDFTRDSGVEKDIRENVLMTFIHFDHLLFGSRVYSSIPLDLFEQIPARDGTDHKTFTVPTYQNPDVNSLV